MSGSRNLWVRKDSAENEIDIKLHRDSRTMTVGSYPDCIRNLPKAKIPFEGVQAWIAQGIEFQVGFFEIEPIGVVPPHSHGAQYGFVIEGEMLLTIGNDTKLFKRGDSYYIPEGVVHSAEFKTFCRIMDFFAEPSRYETE